MAEAAPTLTADEQAFAARMGFHVERGLSFIDAAKAVIGDDARVVGAFFERGCANFFPTADERGRTVHTVTKPGDAISNHISQTVYSALRAEASA